MKLKSEYGNIVEITNNRRRIEYLKSIGYREAEDSNKAKPITKDTKKNTPKTKVKTNEQEN